MRSVSMRRFCVGILLAVLIAATAQASLGTVSLKYVGMQTDGTWKPTLYGPGTAAQYPDLGKEKHFYGGLMKYQVNPDVAGTGEGESLSGTLYGFCMEITQTTKKSFLTYDVVLPEDGQAPQDFLGGPVGEAKANLIRELWAIHAADFVNWTAGDSDASALAFEIAIKEIIYDFDGELNVGSETSFDTTSGNLVVKNGNALADQMLSELDGEGPMANLRALVNEDHQDYLIGFGPDVPEPTTLALLGLGSMLFVRRK